MAGRFPRAMDDADTELQIQVADNRPVADLAGLFIKVKFAKVESLANLPLAKELHELNSYIKELSS